MFEKIKTENKFKKRQKIQSKLVLKDQTLNEYKFSVGSIALGVAPENFELSNIFLGQKQVHFWVFKPIRQGSFGASPQLRLKILR